ncbi:MAG: hypothetical protein ABID09_03450 [Candidatus Omnitrophota bacterium]
MVEDFEAYIKNWDELDDEMKIKASEMLYRRQMIRKWGLRPSQTWKEKAEEERKQEEK